MSTIAVDRERLVRTFIELARIESPSLQEASIAAFVRGELEWLGWDVTDDATGPGVGNLFARRPGSASSTLLSTHLDVVEPCRGVQPRVRDGFVESDGTTVLGADAKAGVAALLEVARTPDVAQDVELLFTWGEELGHRGAKAFDRSLSQATHGFVLDALLPVGSIVTAAPTYVSFTAQVQGRAAHAGVEPERGVSAIAAAAHAIARLPLGRLDDVTTMNVGRIAGGSGRNVVPERAEVVGEIRSLDADRVAECTRTVVETFRTSAAVLGAEIDIDVTQEYAGYRLAETAQSVQQAKRAFASLGGEAVLTSTGGGSDANEFNARGLECCVLGIGAEACHSVRERIAISELVRLAEWVLAIVG